MTKNEVAGIAIRLREERTRHGWTLDELAGRCGLSKSYLSRLEDGERQPSIAALLSIARVYGISLASLFRREPEHCLIVRANSNPVQQGNGLAYKALVGGDRPTAMQPVRLSIPTNRPGDELYSHEGEEWLYVLSGTLLLTLGEETHRLECGDSVYINAEIPHRLNAAGGRDVEVILVACAAMRPLLETYR